MIDLFKNIFLRYKLNKRLKILESQSKEKIKSFSSMVILTPNIEIDEKVFFSLADSLKISYKKITLVVISDKKFSKSKARFRKIIYCSREKVGLLGKFDNEMLSFFDQKFDLLINYFSNSTIFPELVSACCSSKLRLGFYQVNHKINDIILNINLDDKQTFLDESKNYLKALLK